MSNFQGQHYSQQQHCYYDHNDHTKYQYYQQYQQPDCQPQPQSQPQPQQNYHQYYQHQQGQYSGQFQQQQGQYYQSPEQSQQGQYYSQPQQPKYPQQGQHYAQGACNNMSVDEMLKHAYAMRKEARKRYRHSTPNGLDVFIGMLSASEQEEDCAYLSEYGGVRLIDIAPAIEELPSDYTEKQEKEMQSRIAAAKTKIAKCVDKRQEALVEAEKLEAERIERERIAERDRLAYLSNYEKQKIQAEEGRRRFFEEEERRRQSDEEASRRFKESFWKEERRRDKHMQLKEVPKTEEERESSRRFIEANVRFAKAYEERVKKEAEDRVDALNARWAEQDKEMQREREEMEY